MDKKQVHTRKALLDWNPTSSKVQLFKRINSPVDNCMYRNNGLSTNLQCMKWNMYRWTSHIQSCTNKNTALKRRQETKHGSFMATLRQTTCLWLFWLHHAWTNTTLSFYDSQNSPNRSPHISFILPTTKILKMISRKSNTFVTFNKSSKKASQTTVAAVHKL